MESLSNANMLDSRAGALDFSLFFRNEQVSKFSDFKKALAKQSDPILFESRYFSTRRYPLNKDAAWVNIPPNMHVSGKFSVNPDNHLVIKINDVKRTYDEPGIAALLKKGGPSEWFEGVKAICTKHATSFGSSPFISGRATDEFNTMPLRDGENVFIQLKNRSWFSNPHSIGKENECFMIGSVSISDCELVTHIGTMSEKEGCRTRHDQPLFRAEPRTLTEAVRRNSAQVKEVKAAEIITKKPNQFSVPKISSNQLSDKKAKAPEAIGSKNDLPMISSKNKTQLVFSKFSDKKPETAKTQLPVIASTKDKQSMAERKPMPIKGVHNPEVSQKTDRQNHFKTPESTTNLSFRTKTTGKSPLKNPRNNAAESITRADQSTNFGQARTQANVKARAQSTAFITQLEGDL